MNDNDHRPVRFGIVGAGSIARRFAQSLAHVPGAMLAGAWARRADATAAFCETYGGTPAASLDALLASDLDAVYIATLHDSHAQYTLAALAAGKAVLCEKPAALNAAQLDTVLHAARDAGLLFMEAMKPPFFPLYRQLRAHLRDDPIGEIRLVRAGCASSSVPEDHSVYRLDRAGGALLDIGIYEAFLAVDWLGAARDVQTLGRVGATGVDLFASLNSVHANGGIAQLFCGLDVMGRGDALLAAAGGHVTIHEKWWNPARATIRYADGRTVELDAPVEGGGLNYETAHFCDLLRAGETESPIMTHDHSRQMIAMTDAARAMLGVRYSGE
ncbi:TPA: Gfo/Idh/MocA family protein [Burkholderia cenocepacia]|uniref:Gfo/Idh/MocA family protein n=1 Tax=Burkholderia TaxID=32008 RepID=UPI000F67F33D|nr:MULTISPECIES: Gfo/Idh/MocA family oxidoreductase [Burkholderia]MBG0866667.1 Gfo/Idh/MocA family oxidoreductase [Burkholderia sp. 9779_493]MBR7942465.1 Gfo/Idh/MocA family oxidoreductase [Burkholderia cenocepacia]MCA8006725.1 Gfo/Idh/MocA family oxidoreductase [Burkholderia cenocepacia]MCW3503168.1 Gfo/Idh/MocA family oxidoreductase [Burkholderia cenocepacia]MCW3510548.1 Gfo/Idh/MocA family oxidoreductase [Burkholderia cenocepacia]